MVTLDEAVLADPARLSSVERARRTLPVLPMPTDAVARLAARLLAAPMAVVSLVGRTEEYLAGWHESPVPPDVHRRRSLDDSVCKYVVSADRLVGCEDMAGSDDPQLRRHPLTVGHGVRAFLGAPVRDADDRPIGSLTVLDTAPRRWSDEHAATLLEIADALHLKGVGTAPPAIASLDPAALLDSVEEAFLAVNPEGIIVGFNRAAEDLFGYRGEEVCGRHLDASLLPDYDGQPVGRRLDRLFAARSGERLLSRVNLWHRDGHQFTAAVSMSVVRGAAGAVACLFLTDAAKRTPAGTDLRDRDSRFLHALLNNLTVGVIACDADGEVVQMNRAVREIMSLPLDGPLPYDFPSVANRFVHDADGRPLGWDQMPLRRAWRGEQILGADVEVHVPGRRIRTFAITARPISDARGRPLGAMSVANEVTAMRRAERFRECHQAVEHALQTAGSAAEAAPGILEAVCGTLGWPGAELWLLDEATDDLQPVGRWNAPGTDLAEILGLRVTKGFGVTGQVWKTGRPIWVPDIGDAALPWTAEEKVNIDACIHHGIRTVLGVPVRDGDTLLGVLTCLAGAPEFHEDLLTVLLDGVAAQVGVYVALRRAEELARQLTRSKDDFIALVSHEMRTPLTSIVANATMLAEDGGDLDEDRRHMVDAVARNAATLRDVVDTLLDLAGLDSGYLGVGFDRVDLAAVVADAVDAARQTAAGTAVRFGADRPEPLWISGDGGRLRQVVDDLLTNAAKYSPDGGDVEVALIADGSVVELRVSDSGIGTPAEERDLVFERFYRGSNVRHQGTSGNGLGLSLARTIVHLHGGTIRLGERPPHGTTVLVRLPMTRGPAGP